MSNSLNVKSYIPLPDARHLRARSLSAQILRVLGPYIADRNWRDVQEALELLLSREGVEVLTDEDRANAGLPPRGPTGWTTDELLAYEKRKLEVMLQPLPTVVVKA